MKSNLNAVYGAIQQVDKLIKSAKENETMSAEKEKALKFSDKLMKKFKSY